MTYFSATTAAAPKRHNVVSDRTRMILRTFGGIFPPGGPALAKVGKILQGKVFASIGEPSARQIFEFTAW